MRDTQYNVPTLQFKFSFVLPNLRKERVLDKIEKEKLSDHIRLFNRKPKYNKQLGKYICMLY